MSHTCDIFPLTSSKRRSSDEGSAARTFPLLLVKSTLSAPRPTSRSIAGTSLSSLHPKIITSESYLTWAPRLLMSASTLDPLWAPSMYTRGVSQTFSIRPGSLVSWSPLNTCSSFMEKPCSLSRSSIARARPQLWAWCSPGSGTARWSKRFCLVARHTRVCGPSSRLLSKR